MNVLPISDDGERGILGTCLLDPNKIGNLIIKKEHFYHPKHQKLWEVLFEMFANNEPIDTILIRDKLEEKNLSDTITDNYLLGLQDHALVPSHSQHYQQLVIEAFNRRREISILEKALRDTYKGDCVVEDVISNLTLQAIQKNENVPMHELGDRFLQDCIDGKVGNFDWWCEEWTRKLGKMTSELMILHAPRSTGKTALMLQWITNAHKLKYRTPLASIEMLKPELLPRFIAHIGQVNTYFMRTRGFPTQNEIGKSREAINDIKLLEFSVRDKGMSIDDIRGWAIAEAKAGVDAIFIDNLLSINDGGKRYESKTLMYDYFIRRLRDLRDELKIPIILLAHPNQDGLVAWSRDVENFADIIVYMENIHEAIMVNGKTIPQRDYNGDHVIARFQKNRQGESPVASLEFCKNYQTFIHRQWEDVS